MKNKGFTLIELLVVISIIAMLAAYAIPSYRQYVLKSKRAEAHSRLMEVAGLYEKFYANTNAYPTDVSGGGDALSLTADFLEWDDYRITEAPNAGNNATWRIRANAIGAQGNDDTDCPVIWFDNLGRKGPVNSVCWND